MQYERTYAVYILGNVSGDVLYTGMTNNLERRVLEHKSGKGSGFTSKYKVHKLLYYELTEDVGVAIEREKQIKAGSRKKKVELIKSMNPLFRDLFLEITGA